jgi:hypothetical protein
MNKAQKSNYPAFANLHGGWSKINTGIFYWTVFETEGFVLGYLASANVFTKRIGWVLLERKDWIGGKPAKDKKGKKSLTAISVISPNWVDMPDKIRVIYKLAVIITDDTTTT